MQNEVSWYQFKDVESLDTSDFTCLEYSNLQIDEFQSRLKQGRTWSSYSLNSFLVDSSMEKNLNAMFDEDTWDDARLSVHGPDLLQGNFKFDDVTYGWRENERVLGKSIFLRVEEEGMETRWLHQDVLSYFDLEKIKDEWLNPEGKVVAKFVSKGWSCHLMMDTKYLQSYLKFKGLKLFRCIYGERRGCYPVEDKRLKELKENLENKPDSGYTLEVSEASGGKFYFNTSPLTKELLDKGSFSFVPEASKGSKIYGVSSKVKKYSWI